MSAALPTGELKQKPRGAMANDHRLAAAATARSWRVHVFDRQTGEETTVIHLRAPTMQEAEQRAVAKASLHLRGNPAQLEARRVHEVRAQCGNI